MPILSRLETYLREQKALALPKSQFGKAIGYALNQWPALLRYASDGRLEIDNNAMEETLRPCAIGRKNWIFFGSDRGGETAAILFSIVASAAAPYRALGLCACLAGGVVGAGGRPESAVTRPVDRSASGALSEVSS